MTVKSLFSTLLIIALPVGLILFPACSKSPVTTTIMKVETGPFEIIIPAFGELVASQSTPISPSERVQWEQTIAWIAPENSIVKTGDTIIRMNAARFMDQIAVEKSNLAKINIEIEMKEKAMAKEKTDLHSQLNITELEKQFANSFNKKDEEIFSRNEIIESSMNIEFLEFKTRHFKDKTKKLEQKVNAEIQLLVSKRKTIEVKLEQYSQALEAMEIKAPHDGVLIYEKNWRGEKTRVGLTVYPGNKIAQIPDLRKMEATLYILESEASGLKENLPVTVSIDSAPDRIVKGKIKGIDTIAKSIEEKSPLKYFEVKVILDKTLPDVMKPGTQIKASIFVRKLQNVLSVPNQALTFKDGRTYVDVLDGSDTTRREVKIGDRSLTRTVIINGIKPGEKVAL
jgi:HlyD family secretion protein